MVLAHGTCRTIQRSLHTDECKEYANKTIPQPISTNFTLHTNICKGQPAAENFGAEKNGSQVMLDVHKPADSLAEQ